MKLDFNEIWTSLFQIQEITSGNLEKMIGLDCIFESNNII